MGQVNTHQTQPGTLLAPRLLKIKEASRYLSQSPCRLRTLVQRGEIPYIPGDGLTSAWLFDIRDLDEWLERRKTRL
jgi:Helix-turn-helix domain